jgi:hypothetical protein
MKKSYASKGPLEVEVNVSYGIEASKSSQEKF